ncbi:MAG: hypothetical protein LBQ96_06065 [Fusobacteriaceae bacterium]|jgi:hypothetical protein|nr:hypothetical protein [Fusobacteriaceae bacterium]
MRKGMIAIGALLLSSAVFAGGKEPVAPEVQTIVKEVVAPKSGPSGYVDIYYEWRGKSAAHKKSGHKDHLSSNYGTLHAEGELQIDERNLLYLEVENFHAVSRPGPDDLWETEDDHTDFTLEFTHQHDFLGGVACKFIFNNNDGVLESKRLEYQARWNFAEKLLNNDFIQTKDFVLAPKVGYNWDEHYEYDEGAGLSGFAKDFYYGVDLYTYFELPLNFELEFNLYLTQHKYNRAIAENKKKNFTADVELYLYNTTKLVDLSDKLSLSFYFEGGFDPYSHSNRKIFASDMGHPDATDGYTLYALPALRLDYKVTDNWNIYLVAGARTENIHTSSKEAQGWVWQPVAQVGFKVEF